jgi:hypothetical protein
MITWPASSFMIRQIEWAGYGAALAGLALQLPFLQVSESMGNHDSNVVDASSVD